MKDETYYNLLEEVKARVFSAMGKTEDPSLAFSQLEREMKRVKEILISSGHDLKDVNELNTEVQSDIYMSLTR